MKPFPFLVVLAFGAIIGCSAQPTIVPLAKIETPMVLKISTDVPTTSAPTVASAPKSPSPSLTAPSTPSRLTPPATTIPSPGLTQTPPAATGVPATQTQASALPSGTTKTYSNAKLGITLDYPGDWSVTESANGAKFTSPRGETIDLGLVDTHNQLPEDFLIETQLPNMRCLNSTNLHGVTIRNCLDTVSFSYTAHLILKLPNGVTRLVVIYMRAKSPNPVFDAMIASARITP
ncbi:MAG: hypothetical protein HY868_02315 [Chloroflexi bacterium]|nr:hypothetical protein [Chloroflexota bacterium]